LKAIFSNKYGPPEVLELTEVENPIPKDNHVLVKIHAASLNYGNLVLLKGKPFLVRFAYGLRRPKYPIPGGDIAGSVEAVGKEVKSFQPGDEVFGELSGCGWGGFAEYVSVPEQALAVKQPIVPLRKLQRYLWQESQLYRDSGIKARFSRDRKY